MNPCWCRCGLPFDPDGTCPHCDRPVLCTTPCPPCFTRDSTCVICGTFTGTPPAGASHEKACRTKETQEPQ